MENKFEKMNEKELIYDLLQRLSRSEFSVILAGLNTDIRSYVLKRGMDEANEEDLKRITFKFHDEYESLWDLREFRGFLEDSAQSYSVLSRIATNMHEITMDMDEGELKQELADLATSLSFFIGDA
jgi:hypothetical protein